MKQRTGKPIFDRCDPFVIKKYEDGVGEGWSYEWSNKPSELYRQLTAVWYLNDVEEGGEDLFPFQETIIKPETGKLIIYPSTQTHIHNSNSPVNDDKYIITTCLTNYYPRWKENE